jgi:integrase
VGANVGENTRLTHSKALSIKPGDKPVSDGTVVGLVLEPGTKKGRGRWNLRFSSPETGKRRDMGLGSFPDVSIDKAREAARDARKLIAAKIDPIEHRRIESVRRSRSKDTKSFEAAAREVWENKKRAWKNVKHIQQWISTLEQYVFPKIGKIEINKLNRNEFRDVLDPIWLSKPETASRVRQRCSDVMHWALASDLTTTNPVVGVEVLLPDQPSKSVRLRHHPKMAWEKLPEFVQAHLQGSPYVSKLGLEFLILTAARSGEVRLSTWSEIDFENKIWTIPNTRMKAKKEHRVPLSDRAIEILMHQRALSRHEVLIFPSPNGKVASDMIFTSFLRKHKIASDTANVIATAHGFRSSFRNWASQKGYTRDLAERALSHTIQNKTEAAYHQTDLLEERRPMMDAWAKHVCLNKKNNP